MRSVISSQARRGLELVQLSWILYQSRIDANLGHVGTEASIRTPYGVQGSHLRPDGLKRWELLRLVLLTHFVPFASFYSLTPQTKTNK